MENNLRHLDSAFHALADPTRRAVIARLTAGAAPVKTLAEPFDMGLPSFLKHLRVLEDSGLILTEKSGRTRTCRLCASRLAETERWIANQRQLWEDHADRLANYIENQMSGEDTQ
ncbi:MAG TPA: ArsR family transcriptional regulator [Henriciella marina]|uniref:ArsR/SmtB family transcription factor n=1 Tax=Henriciella sp. TaxID=1968823 RepID=UPI0017F75F27|nr:metalloregulator ArsR/SmtB family transcription factor [Henriciella sp.]HIG23950.1 ArsR family transcriptional regulator [Henriciella sp.]HIK65388.1 ArsR family transcriptional regulator [Henriciella marina]